MSVHTQTHTSDNFGFGMNNSKEPFLEVSPYQMLVTVALYLNSRRFSHKVNYSTKNVKSKVTIRSLCFVFRSHNYLSHNSFHKSCCNRS